MSSVWSEVCSVLGISRIMITSFHPQSNGMIERFHRFIKTFLWARLVSFDWDAHLPLVMLGLRSLPKDNSSFSPAEAVYGSDLSLPGEFLKNSELPLESVQGFSGPPQHHVIPQPQPQPLPRALKDAEFVFV